MTGPQRLAQAAGRLKTKVGAAFPGERAVFRGHDLHTGLKDMGWIDLCAFGITGRRLSAAQLKLVESMWVWTSYPDARIWNNRVAALAGSTRSTPALALSAGQAVSEAMIYGRRNEFRALAFFKRTHQAMLAGASLGDCIDQHLAQQGKLAGYGRPLASGDERIGPTMALARELGLADGPHVTLAFEVDRLLQARGRPLRMNFGALVSAFGADFGFSPRDCNLFYFPIFLAGMQPCYVEAADQPPGTLFPTACADVAYEGRGKRAWVTGA
ncbi:MAG: citryl-CoA lyase [Rubrivivax sp.]|nr:MAG: citryl-CoA lyase [Rubrivivax sp.]